MHKPHKKNKTKKIQRFDDVPELIERINNQTPKTGQYFYDYKLQQAKKDEDLLDSQQFHRKYKINFSDLPISRQCIKGLNKKGFEKMTQVQRCVIPHALSDRDIIAASRTGSGKTLSYLVPLIQKLYRNKFIPLDGLGAIVLVPVRELAMQVFEVLNSFTESIQISVGLVIGGKNVNYEKQRIRNMNILVCTPGRLLQHLQETYGFQANNLQMLVLDQADVMLQMGFQQTLKSIINHLPRCQTMLFSATLNNRIHLLANMSMQNPEKIFLHSKQSAQQLQSTKGSAGIYEIPAKLTQYYMVMKDQQKVNTLFSFLKTHQREKIIVFASTCKQVRFLYEAFKKFRMGLPMYELQGHQKQKKRMAIYFTFCQKKYGLMICTNIASRGLDFPMVDWVIQYDVPEDTQTYVHRVGRTARFKYEGKSLTFISQNQRQFINQLKQKNIKIHKIKQNPEKYFKIESSLQSICSQHQDVKYLAQRALISYLKFVHKASNKSVFSLKNINTAKLAESFGIQNAPVINIKNNNKESQDDQNQEKQKLTKIQKLRLKSKMKKNQIKQKKIENKNSDKLNQNQDDDNQDIDDLSANHQQSDESSEDDDLLKVKTSHKNDPNAKQILSVTKNRMKKIRNQGLFDGKNKIHFDQDLKPITDDDYLKQQYLEANKKNIQQQGQDFYDVLEKNKQIDEQIQKQRRKQKRRKINEQKLIAKGDILSQKARLKKGYGQQIAVLGESEDQQQQ